MKASLMTLIFGALVGFGAMAQGPSKECASDVEKFCKDTQPGEGRIVECLKSHDAELSAECKASWAAKKVEMKQVVKEIHAACEEDQKKFCADVEKGKRRIMKCLKSHKAELSEACKTEIAKGGKNKRQ